MVKIIYRVLKQNEKTSNMIKHDDYKDLESAEKAMGNLKSRSKKRSLKLVQIPEYIGVGYEIYRVNGELYGTITEETSSFYIVSPAWKKTENNMERPFFLKERFLDKFEQGHFKAVDGDPEKIKKYENVGENDIDDILEEEEDD